MTNSSDLSSSIMRQRIGSWALPGLIRRFRQKGKKKSIFRFVLAYNREKKPYGKIGGFKTGSSRAYNSQERPLGVGQVKRSQLQKHSHTRAAWSNPLSRESMNTQENVKGQGS